MRIEYTIFFGHFGDVKIVHDIVVGPAIIFF